jgi:hypothetical protein
MFLGVILISVYISVAIFAIVMTLSEQQDAAVGCTYCKILGVLACVVWPVTFFVVAVAAQFQAPEILPHK